MVRLDTIKPHTRVVIFPATQGAKPFGAFVIEQRPTSQQRNPSVIVQFIDQGWNGKLLSLGGGTSAVIPELYGDLLISRKTDVDCPKAFLENPISELQPQSELPKHNVPHSNPLVRVFSFFFKK